MRAILHDGLILCFMLLGWSMQILCISYYSTFNSNCMSYVTDCRAHARAYLINALILLETVDLH